MSIKNNLTKTARKVLPKSALVGLERTYRKSRAKVVAARYGNPARDLRVIAVTGTNGKTTTVNFLNEILKEAGYRTAMFSTANIEIAGSQTVNDTNSTTATVARLQKFFRDAKKADIEFALIEATSHALDQYKFEGVPIEMAIMTNLTQDHLDYHKTMEKYAAAKGLLFARNPRYIVLNRDDDWFDYFDRYLAEEQKITYGKSEDADVRISDIRLYKKGSEATLAFDHQEKSQLATYLPGEYNVFNMAAAASICYVLGVSMSDIKNGIASLEGIPGRFERATKDEKYEVIVDYAHTPDALEKLLEATRNITKKRIILVFGACGDRDALKRPIMGKIAAKLADEIILTDEESYNENPDKIRRDIYAGIEESKATNKTTEIADRREAIRHALNIAKKDDTILITGMGHEQFRIINGEKLPWNDTNIVREIISEKIKKQ